MIESWPSILGLVAVIGFALWIGRKSELGIDKSIDIGEEALSGQTAAIEMMKQQMRMQEDLLQEVRAIREHLQRETR